MKKILVAMFLLGVLSVSGKAAIITAAGLSLTNLYPRDNYGCKQASSGDITELDIGSNLNNGLQPNSKIRLYQLK